MNAIALIMCSVIAGADARETIPTSQKLYEVINRTYGIDQAKDLEVQENGALLQTTGVPNRNSNIQSQITLPVAEFQRKTFIGKYRLQIVPCPGHPNFLLAGYLRDDEEAAGIEKNVLDWSVQTVFCLLIDSDHNIVVPLDEPTQRVYLDLPRIEAISKELSALLQSYVQQIAQQPTTAPYVTRYRTLQKQFVSPPPIEATAQATLLPSDGNNRDERVAQVYIGLTFSADCREVKYEGPTEIRSLLATTIALPAEKYFAAAPFNEKTEPTSTTE